MQFKFDMFTDNNFHKWNDCCGNIEGRKSGCWVHLLKRSLTDPWSCCPQLVEEKETLAATLLLCLDIARVVSKEGVHFDFWQSPPTLLQPPAERDLHHHPSSHLPPTMQPLCLSLNFSCYYLVLWNANAVKKYFLGQRRSGSPSIGLCVNISSLSALALLEEEREPIS